MADKFIEPSELNGPPYPAAVKVGGQCYKKVGNVIGGTSNASPDSEHDDCDDCLNPECPTDCATCPDPLFSTFPNMSSTCDGTNCDLIVDQQIDQVGDDCRYTSTDGVYLHESLCENGVWYYRVWKGGVGGTLCAEWTEVDTTSVAQCVPLGTTGDGTWIRTGGVCDGDDFALNDTCPSDCSLCTSPLTATLTCPGAGSPLVYTFNRSGCFWLPVQLSFHSMTNLECRDSSTANACGHNPGYFRWTFCIQVVSPSGCDTIGKQVNFYKIADGSGCPPLGTYTSDDGGWAAIIS